MKNVFSAEDSQELKSRISNLKNESQPQWGKMNVSQMLAHCNVAYEMTYEPTNFKKPKGIKKWVLKTFLKPIIVGSKPFKKNSPTSSDFKIADYKNFEIEKNRMIAYVDKTQQLGKNHFEGLDNLSFGVMNSTEWNNLFYKHLDHHLKQFGV